MSADYEAQARASARASFERTAGRDVRFFACFVASWMVRNLTLGQLADLVEQMDRAFPGQAP